MQTFKRLSIALSILTVTLACGAQERKLSQPILKNLTQSRAMKLSQAQVKIMSEVNELHCPADTADGLIKFCEAFIKTENSGGACTANVVNGIIRFDKGTRKSMVWTLAPADKGWYEFHARDGIMIRRDDYAQVRSKGKWDGTRNQFYVSNLNDQLGAEVQYVPVVYWRPGGEGTDDMVRCKAIDPKIVNEGQ